MSKLEELQAQARIIQGKMDDIRAAEAYEQAKKLVGKCFKYRNCYSCPDSDADYWWLYRRVVSASKDGYVKMFTFQTDKYGQTTIKVEDRFGEFSGNCTQITHKQFQHAWRVAARRINQLARENGAMS